jgi:hypothetical protein
VKNKFAECDSRKYSKNFPVSDMWEIFANSFMQWDYSRYCILPIDEFHHPISFRIKR